ncbi:MAG: hypothetical protein ACW98X_17790 [Promethearchaeota archaeon]|jgi:hypothetical protein
MQKAFEKYGNKTIEELTNFEFVSELAEATMNLMKAQNKSKKLEGFQNFWRNIVLCEIDRRFGDEK